MKKNIFLAVLVCTSTFFSCKKNQTESIDPISRRVVNVAELENKYMFLSENPTTENLDEFKKYIENQMTLSKQMFDLEISKESPLKKVVSSDRKIAVMSWDNQLGGSMRFWDRIWMWKTKPNDSVYYKTDYSTEDAKGLVHRIETIETAEKVYYLVFERSIFSSKYVGENVTAYEIINNRLMDVALFRIQDKKESRIAIDYEWDVDNQGPHIQYDIQSLTFPIIKNEKLTTQSTVLTWREDHFE